MLSLSGLAGAASESAATPSTTVMLDIAAPDPSVVTSSVGFFDLTPITLAGAAAPQFYFGFEYEPPAVDATGNGSTYVAYDVLFTAELVSSETDFGTDNNGNTVTNAYSGTPYGDSAIAKPGSLTGELPSLSESFSKPAGISGVYANPVIEDSVDLSNINLVSYKVNGAFSQSDFYKHAEFTSGSQEYLATFHVDANGGIPEVTYAAVPEPEAWALLIAGAAMTGAALRARRRKAPAAA
jgi:hypothetical protein